MKRPTRPQHFGNVENQKDFFTAFSNIEKNNKNVYSTKKGTNFTASAGYVTKGARKGQPVIMFKKNGKERARAYECCWGHQTNCNRTYIDSYTPII